MLVAEVASEFFDDSEINVLNEARAVDRAYGAGSWIEMAKHYEEEERFATFLEDESPFMCPACRAKLSYDDEGYALFRHEEDCAWVPWHDAVEEAILRSDEY